MKNILIAIFISIIMFGCLGGGEAKLINNNSTTPTPQQPTSVSNPSFNIVSPSQGQVYKTDKQTIDIDVTLVTSNLIIRPSGGLVETGEGHFEFRIDNGGKINVFSKKYTLKAVPPGTHTLSIELVHNDNKAYTPAIKKSVTFTVEKKSSVYQPKTYTVDIMDFSYSPESLSVKVGDSVTFENTGKYPRSATSTGVFDTKVIAPGKKTTLRMDKQGTHNYFSLTHTAMKGTIVVKANKTN